MLSHASNELGMKNAHSLALQRQPLLMDEHGHLETRQSSVDGVVLLSVVRGNSVNPETLSSKATLV